MKRISTLFAVLFAGSLVAQTPDLASADAAPAQSNVTHYSTQSLWQVLFDYDITAAGGGLGHAAVVPVGTGFWVSKWQSDTIDIFSATGTLTSRIQVSGVTGIRSFTTDGTTIYAGTNAGVIEKIDPVTQTHTGTIGVPSVANVRYCTYDPTANSGAGGFWVGSWATDISLVSMSGASLSTIPAGTHALTASYGMAFDNVNPGGPFLWSFHQTGASNAADLIQVDIATGAQTTVMHDVTTDLGAAGQLAGGVYIVNSPFVLVGVLQGSNNHLFSYDINLSGINEGTDQSDMIGVYPNPAKNSINVHINRTNNDPMQIRIVNAMGQVVSESENVGMNNLYNVESFDAGIYFVMVTCNGTTYSTRFVRE